jgi:chitinase
MYFYVFLSRPSTTTLNVSFQTTPGSAHTGSDFQNRNGTLSFAPGETVKTITVNIVGDTLEEDQETFTVGLNSPTGGAVIGDGSATGTIVDNDGEDPPPPETYLYLPLLRH